MKPWQRFLVRTVDGIGKARDGLLNRLRPKREPFNKGFVCKQVFTLFFGAALIELFTNVSMQFFDPFRGLWQVFDPVTWPVLYSQVIYALAVLGAVLGLIISTRALIHLVNAANEYVEQLKFEEYCTGVTE